MKGPLLWQQTWAPAVFPPPQPRGLRPSVPPPSVSVSMSSKQRLTPTKALPSLGVTVSALVMHFSSFLNVSADNTTSQPSCLETAISNITNQLLFWGCCSDTICTCILSPLSAAAFSSNQ